MSEMTAEERARHILNELESPSDVDFGDYVTKQIRAAQREARLAAINLEEAEALIAELAGMTQEEIVRRMRESR